MDVSARITADFRGVAGTLTLRDRVGQPPQTRSFELINPLALLPETSDDRTLLRRFPGRPDQGVLTWQPEGPGRWRFWTVLPRRYGDLGQLPREGLRANGGWYPTVRVNGQLPVLRWEVDVSVPDGGVVVVNGQSSVNQARFSGRADRVSLAALPEAQVQTIGGWTLISRRREARIVRWLTELDRGWPLDERPPVTLVVGRDLERLAVSAPGMVFLSERTFRLSPGVQRYHLAAVRRRVIDAGLPLPGDEAPTALGEPWWRAFVAAALTEGLPAASASRELSWFRWNPIIDAVLNDGTLPFFDETFDAPHLPTGGVSAIAPVVIGPRAAALQLSTLLGPDTVLLLAEALLAGEEPAAAALNLGVPPSLIAGWSTTYDADQDVDVVLEDGVLVATRSAAPDAPAEVVGLELDGGVTEPWLAGPGPDQLRRPLDPQELAAPRRVRADAAGSVNQASRANDSWPPRWSTVVTGGVQHLQPATLEFEGFGQLIWRKQGDTRNVWYAGLVHDQEDLVGLYPGYSRSFGPLLDRRRRAHRVGLGLGLALLDPGFRPTDSGALALGSSVTWAWDTRVSDVDFSRGSRISAGVGAGFIPGATLDRDAGAAPDRWASASVGGVHYFPLHPRHMLATRGRLAVASGEVEHRLLTLGGASGVRGLPADVVLGQQLVLLSLEDRATPIFGLSVPVGVGWLSALQIVPGVDAGVLWRDQQPYLAVGAAGGLWAMVDLAGARPTLAGVTIAAPVALAGLESGGPQVFFDFFHPF